MNRNTLEAYAQKARRDFIVAVTGRAAFYGLTANNIEPVVEQGDVTMIGAHAFPRTMWRTRASAWKNRSGKTASSRSWRR